MQHYLNLIPVNQPAIPSPNPPHWEAIKWRTIYCLAIQLAPHVCSDSHGLLFNPVLQPIRPSYSLFEKAIPVSLPKLTKTAESQILLYLPGNMLSCYSFADTEKKDFRTQQQQPECQHWLRFPKLRLPQATQS